MVEESRPWPGDVLTGSPGDAGPYSDGQWDDVWGILFGSEEAPYGNRGVVRHWEDELEVTDPGIVGQVDVGTGAALVHGKFYRNTEVVPIVGIDPAPGGVGGAWREDTILLRSHWTLQTIRIYWHKNSGNEVTYETPVSEDGVVWYIPLAAVRIDDGGVITQITDLRVSVYNRMTGAPAVLVYHNVDQSIPDATYTTVAFNTEGFDTDGMHSTTVNNSRLTCVMPGKYQISASVSFDVSDVGLRLINIRINGGVTIARQTTMNVGAAIFTSLMVSRLYELAIGDYLEVRAYQTSGGALNVEYTADDSPRFGMVRVAD